LLCFSQSESVRDQLALLDFRKYNGLKGVVKKKSSGIDRFAEAPLRACG